jgi:hypothetical protein
VHELASRLAELEELVDGMTRAEEIAHAVVAAQRRERRNVLSVPQRLAGAILALLVAVPAVHELVVWIGG